MQKFISIVLVISIISTFIPIESRAEDWSPSTTNQTSIAVIPLACDYAEGTYAKDSLLVTSRALSDEGTIETIVNKDDESNSFTGTSLPKKFTASALFTPEEDSFTSKTAYDADIEEFNKAMAESSVARTYEVNFPEVNTCEELQSIIDEISNLPDVEAVSLNHIFKSEAIRQGTPNDPDYNTQWGLTRIKADQAWQQNITGQGVTVGVIDSELFVNHPDITNNIAYNSSEANGIANRDDDNNKCVDDISFCNIDKMNQSFSRTINVFSHGTHVAGTIAATGDNSIGGLGVAPDAKIVFAALHPRLSSANIIKGFQYLVKRKVKIINMSLGFYDNVNYRSSQTSDPLYKTIVNTIKSGVVVIVSAGNSAVDVDNAVNPRDGAGTLVCSGTCYSYFPNIPGVITVAAINSNNNRASFSDFGNNVDIAAPGEDIVSLGAAITTSNEIVYTSWNTSGTSMAAPHVAGAAALLKSKYPQLTGAQISESLIDSVTPISSLRIGGILDVQAALEYARVHFIDVVGNFNITSPRVNQDYKNKRPKFTWTVPVNTDSSLVKYQVIVRNNETARNIINQTLDYGLFYPTATELISPIDLATGNYTIYVTASNRTGNSRQVSRVFSVTLPYTTDEIVESLKIDSGTLFYNASQTLMEKRFYSELSSKWYYILPNGELYESVSEGKVWTMKNGTDKLLANIGAAYYQNIRKFPQLARLNNNAILAALGLDLRVVNNSVRFNQSGTDYEKWFTGNLGYNLTQNSWYLLMPNGKLVRNNAERTVIMNLPKSYYLNINLIPGIRLDIKTMITAHNYLPDSAGNTLFNRSGENYEKWLYGSYAGTRAWTTIEPSGLVSTGQGLAFMKLSPSYFINPTAFDTIVESPDAFFWLMNKRDIKLTKYRADDQLNWSGQYQEKWLRGVKKANESSTPLYYLMPDGRLYRYTGGGKNTMITDDVLVARVNSQYYNDIRTIVYTAK